MNRPDPRSSENRFPVRLTGWLPDLAALGIITAVSLAITFPLILHLADWIPGWPGDNVYFFWEFWWFKRALLDLHVSPFVDHELYYPVGLELARDEITPANTVLGLPLTAWFGPTVSYNTLVLLSLVLSGYAVYRFVFETTRNRLAALIGGLAFAIAPFRMVRLAGHINLLATQWLALSLLFLEKFFRSRRIADSALAGVWFGLNALAAWYYLYIGAVALIVFSAVRAWHWRENLRERRLWYGALCFLFLAGAFFVPFAIPYLQLRESGGLQRAFTELDAWSANPTDFIQPNPLHPVWGKAVREIFPFQWKQEVERTLSLGTALLLLAIVGMWTERKNRTAQALALMTIAAIVIALGPTLHVGGSRVEYPLPQSAVRLVEQIGVTAALGNWFDPSLAATVHAGRGFVPLPAMLMYALVPLTSSIRAILRFGFVGFLGVALLAGYGLNAVMQAMHGRMGARNVAAIVVGGLMLFELWSVPRDDRPIWTIIQPRPVDVWLAAQPEQAVIVEYPVAENVSAAMTIHHTFNRQRMVLGGFPPSFKPQVLFERAERIKSFPSASALAALREYGTRYVLVTPALFASAGEWEDFKSNLDALSRLELVNEIGGVLVYEIK